MVICLAVRYWSAERERTRNVMALEARWNVVLKRDCWLTMDCERVGRYRLFGNVGFEFSDASR